MFTETEAKAIKPYFTNLDGKVFCLVNLPEVIKGALFSRYSRSPNSLRRILLDEFISNPDVDFGSSLREDALAVGKAESFYDRILVGYGDDSVAELGGAHVAIEGVSNVATKVIEDSRIGLSPLEKSTRYVRFDDKVDGNYQFYRDSDIMASKNADYYLDACNFLFDTYAGLMDPVAEYVKENNPQGEESDRAYNSTIRAKSCDLLRGLLPASTQTNMGLFGNGRAFEYLITKMYSSDLREVRDLADQMHGELSKVIPSFVKRAKNNHGAEYQKYLKDTYNDIRSVSLNVSASPKDSQDVTLVEYGDETTAIACMMYPHLDMSLSELRNMVAKMSDDQKGDIIKNYLQRRSNRRHKPGRALENLHYSFDILANYGAYRDLHRHRMLTQERQLLGTKHGFDLPPDLIEGGFDGKFKEAMGVAHDAYTKLSGTPLHAQYVVPMAYKIRWYMSMNMREAFFLTELRSSRQGHPDYRVVAQKIYEKIKQVHPNIAQYIKFVDMNSYSLERLDSEKKIDQKISQLNDSKNSSSVE